jgi:hypothetical protein
LTDPAEPGNVDLETGTTSGSIGAFYIPARTTAFDPSSNFDMTFRVKADSSSNVTARAGYGDSTSSFDAPANGIYLEHLDTDTNWFCVARASSTQARTNSAVAFGTSWIWLRVRRKDASTIGCTVATTMANVLNTANEVTVTTNIPTAGTGMLSFTMIKNTAAADKHWALGYFDNIITGLTR